MTANSYAKKIIFAANMNLIRQKVALHGVRFFAYHGFYPVEQILGSEFLVDIETNFDVTSDDQEDLEQSINYESLYEIASKSMQQTSKLLETVAHAMLRQIRDKFPTVKTIRVLIRKMNPPLPASEVSHSLVELKFQQ